MNCLECGRDITEDVTSGECQGCGWVIDPEVVG
jgi:DNA-directed RNA polymerase subunit RPC12/RpoP